MMGRVLAMAGVTWKEILRGRILYILLAFTLLLLLFSSLLSSIAVGDSGKVIQDLGLTAMLFMNGVTAIILGVLLVYKEVKLRTAYAILAKPIRRHEFILGKFVGLVAVLLLNLSAMTLMWGLLLLLKHAWSWSLLIPVLGIALELLVLTAMSIFFSALSSPAVGGLFVVAGWLIGHTSWVLKELLPHFAKNWLGQTLGPILYHILPDFEVFSWGNIIVYQGESLSPHFLAQALGYAGLYTLVFLLLAVWAFDRRDLA